MKRKLSASALIVAAIVSITGCSGASSKTPDTVLKEYVTALNEGDFETALSYVADPEEVTSDNLAKPSDISIPEPQSLETEIEDGVDAVALKYQIGETSSDIQFSRGDDGWQLQTVEFISPQEFPETGLFGMLLKNDVIPEPVDGVELYAADYVVLYGEAKYPAAFSFPGNRFIDAAELVTEVSYKSAGDGDFEISAADYVHRVGVDENQRTSAPISESFFSEIEKEYEVAEPWNPNDAVEFAVTQFVKQEDCEDAHLVSAIRAGYGDGELDIDCFGGEGTATAIADDLIMGPRGTTVPGTLMVKVEIDHDEMSVKTIVSQTD